MGANKRYSLDATTSTTKGTKQMKTIKQQYQNKRDRIENYCRNGMTIKSIALKFEVKPDKMANIIKALDISVMRLRNEGYKNAN